MNSEEYKKEALNLLNRGACGIDVIEQLGLHTTFKEDFKIAEAFGQSAIKETYKRAKTLLDDVVYLTELSLTMNNRLWALAQVNEPMARLYEDLWYETKNIAAKLKTKEDKNYFYKMTD